MCTKKEHLSLKDIKNRIANEINTEIIIQLSDAKLLEEYKKSKSAIKKLNKFKQILDDENVNIEKQNRIIDKILIDLIPAGTKGVIRGNKFNEIVQNKILNIKLNNDIFSIKFEKNCKYCQTNETPDWYILEKLTGKVIIGMNQVDLWNGGQQLNRGFKYIHNNPINTVKSKLLCVIANDPKLITTKNKVYHLFNVGFQNDTLCYVNGLESIIYAYFNLPITD